MIITLLGTGTSHGVPMIGCDCRVCTSPDPRDQRTRPSIHVEDRGVHVLIDTSPELRLQCLANDIRRVDAVLFTHNHMDHVAGLDDLRRFNWLQKGVLPCYARRKNADAIRSMFPYAFEDDPSYPSQKPRLEFNIIEGPFELSACTADGGPVATTVVPVPLMHGPTPVLGFRFGDFAYCTDCNFIADEALDLLEGLDVLILDALRRRPHPTHFNLEQAVDMAYRIQAKQTYFTHIAHELYHADVNEELPMGMALGYDGMRLRL